MNDITKEPKIVDVNLKDNWDGTYMINAVTKSGEYQLGVLEWDDDQEAYVLWTGTSYSETGSGWETNSDEGVSYYDSVQETKDAIKDEIVDSLINE